MKFTNYLIKESFNDILKELVGSIEKFVFTNDKKYIAQIVKFKSQIPPNFRKGGKLYRGMVMDGKSISSLESGNNITLGDYSSWTSNIKMAKSFITDPKKAVGKAGHGVIFQKTIPDNKIVLNIGGLIMFLNNSMMLDNFDFDDLTKEMAMDEQEFICDKGITITKKDIYQKV